MLTVLSRLRKSILGLSVEETTVRKRGFRASGAAVAQLERVGREFLLGYNAALDDSSPVQLAARLQTSDHAFRGYAFEGAAMALMLSDNLRLTRNAFGTFMNGAGNSHIYMLNIGAGWAIARLPWLRRNLSRSLKSLDPLLGWLAVDGYGFHEGYFRWQDSIAGRRVPAGVEGYAQCVFDQGLGRSLWFVEGADPDRIADRIRYFGADRQPHLWSGVGLMATYAGGLPANALQRLQSLAGESARALAQGAAFAAAARQRAGNLVPHNDEACRIFCGLPASLVAEIPIDEMRDLPSGGTEPAFEVWRSRIRSRLARTAAKR